MQYHIFATPNPYIDTASHHSFVDIIEQVLPCCVIEMKAKRERLFGSQRQFSNMIDTIPVTFMTLSMSAVVLQSSLNL